MKFNTAELLELLSNGENKDHYFTYYLVIEKTSIIGEHFMSLRKFNIAKLLER